MRLSLVVWFAVTAFAQNDFDAARWVLRQGGRVRLVGNPRVNSHVPDLPATPFRVEAVDLIGSTFDPLDMKRLSGLTEVRELLLPGPIFNPGAGSRLDANAEFAALAPLTKLEKLHLSLHFLTNINVLDKGLEHLKASTAIRELRLAQSRVKGPSLAAFVNLEKLDLNYTTFGDDGLKYLSKKLTTLYLRDTLVTDKGMEALGQFTNLEYLDLSGARLTDAGIRSLKALTKLRSLNLLGAELSDDALSVLSGFPALEELNIYRSQVSNAGLKKLESLKQLRHLDVRYTRVSRAGVENLSKAVPACKTEFVDASAAAVSAAVRHSRPAARTDEAVAAWVPQIGGSAHFSEGRLRRLDLSRTPVSDEQLAHLGDLALDELRLDSTEISDAALARLPRGLKRLNLSNTGVTVQGLAALPPALEELDLSNTAADDRTVPLIPASVVSLNLAYSSIGNDGIKLLAARPLVKLDLTATDIENEGLAAIARIASLRDLRISYGRYTDKAITALAGLRGLERLEMVRTRLTDEGLKALTGLTKLRVLRLDYTKTSDKGLAWLPPSLEELTLDTADVSDEGIETLAKFQHLRLLNLYHTTVTEKGFERLQAALPDCRIVYDRDSSIPIRRKS